LRLRASKFYLIDRMSASAPPLFLAMQPHASIPENGLIISFSRSSARQKKRRKEILRWRMGGSRQRTSALHCYAMHLFTQERSHDSVLCFG
jgi:hypothetical protein